MTRLRTSAILPLATAVAGCAALGLAGLAAADAGTDILVGGAQCGLAPPKSCQPSQANITLPAGANGVQVSFKPNNNPCAGLSATIDEGGNPIAQGTFVQMAPGAHTLNVTPTCSQALTSWGGDVRVDFIHRTGASAPNAQAVPTNAVVVNVSQTPTKVTVNAQNTSTTPGDCFFDATPTNHTALLQPRHQDFHLNGSDAKGSSVALDFVAPPLGSTYHLTVVCKAEPAGQEMGHFEQDVTGRL